jgi:hypothetical protein
MPIGFTRVVGTGDIPVWQRVDQLVQGGFVLDRTDYADGDVIKAGTPVVFNEATRMAKPLLTAVLNANATNSATTYQVKKGHKLATGKYFAASSGGAAYAITAIDTSNADYDVITVGTTLGVALTAGQLLFASTATGASAATYGGVNGLLYADKRIDVAGISQSISVVLRGTIYARRVPYSANLETALKAAGAFIIYSQSF